jgi:hypothetical protein
MATSQRSAPRVALLVVAAVLITMLVGACGFAHSATRPPAAVHLAPTTSSYRDVESLIAAMTVHGAVCSG